MLIKIENPKGVIPKLEPHLLPNGASQEAVNCHFDSGSLVPFKETTTIVTPTKVGTKRTIYLFDNSFWFHWTSDVDVVRVPLGDDADEITCFTDGTLPKITKTTLATAGGTDYPEDFYTLGVPAPVAAPVCVVVGASVDPSLAENRAYVVTFICDIGGVEMEGPPSPVSNIVVVEPTQSVSITIPAIPAGDYNFTKKRIYRTANAGTAGTTEYKYVDEIDDSDLTYSDAVATASLGDEIESTTWDAPPSDLQGIKLHPSQFLVGFSDQELCVSVAGQPHAWPVAWRQKVDYPIVAIAVIGTAILVTTTADPYYVTGTSPDGLTAPERLGVSQSCVSKRGMVDAGFYALYPSPDGLVRVGQGVEDIVTANIMDRADWQALTPSTITGAFHDGKYYGFYNNGTSEGFILDLETGDLSYTDIYATATFVDKVTDTLYLQVGDDIVSWNTGTDDLMDSWKSKRFFAPRPITPGVAQILADEYPITFKLYASLDPDTPDTMTLKHTQTVTSEEPFRLPGGYKTKRVEAIVTGGKWHTVNIAERMADLRQG